MPVDPNIYSVYLDGRPVQRGMSKSAAYAHAEYLSRGFDGKRASTKRRTPEVNVKIDCDLVKQDDQLYNWVKQGG